MDTTANAANWFEIPVTDFDRARKFYSTLLDFEIPVSEMGPLRMGILPYKPGEGIGGAIVWGDTYEPSDKGTRVYLNGEPDLQLLLDRVEAAGGAIILKKNKINDEVGYMAIIKDTEGNLVSLHSMK